MALPSEIMRQQTLRDDGAVNDSASRHGWTEIATRDPHLRSFVRGAAPDRRGALPASPSVLNLGEHKVSRARAPLAIHL